MSTKKKTPVKKEPKTQLDKIRLADALHIGGPLGQLIGAVRRSAEEREKGKRKSVKKSARAGKGRVR